MDIPVFCYQMNIHTLISRGVPWCAKSHATSGNGCCYQYRFPYIESQVMMELIFFALLFVVKTGTHTNMQSTLSTIVFKWYLHISNKNSFVVLSSWPEEMKCCWLKQCNQMCGIIFAVWQWGSVILTDHLV